MKDKFKEALGKLSGFLAEEGFAPIEPNQCEVSYINQIPVTDEHDWWAGPEKLFVLWGAIPRLDEREALEDSRFQIRYVQYNDAGEPFARLIVAIEPGTTTGAVRVVQFTLSVKGQPLEPNEDGVLAFFDLGRERIVKKFDALTTRFAHGLWEKREHVRTGEQ